MKRRGGFCLLAMALVAAVSVCAAAESGHLAHVESSHSVENTVERARRMIESQGLRVFGVIDHQAAAKKVGETMAPTRVVVFGNPKTGTQLMRENPLIALDLPMKLLVWEDSNGVTWISYLRAGELARRHGFAAQDKRFTRIASVLKDFARSAAR